MVSLRVDAPMPAIQTVAFSNVAGGTFTLRVMADAYGGAIDAVTAPISFNADAATVDTELEAVGGASLVQVTKSTGMVEHAPQPC